nr:hypothetical protein Iba_chr09fCG13360 [Ipomoea batatas]
MAISGGVFPLAIWEIASQESSSRQSERRARKGKAPMERPSARIPKEEDEDR